MKKAMKRLLAATSAGAVLCGSLALSSLLGSSTTLTASAATDSVADQTKVGTLGIAGGGFVSGIILSLIHISEPTIQSLKSSAV